MNGKPPDIRTMLEYQQAFVKPMVEALRTELEGQLQPLVESHKSIAGLLEAHNARIKVLESSQKKALLGWSLYASGAAVALSFAWNWLRTKIHWN